MLDVSGKWVAGYPQPWDGHSGASSLLPTYTASLLFFCLDGSVHHFNLGRRIPGFDYGPDGFGTGLTPLHLSDDGEGGTFHFHDPPPPYTAYKCPDMDQPDDPPPPYEASINPDSVFYDPAGACPSQGEGMWNVSLSGMLAWGHRVSWDLSFLLDTFPVFRALSKTAPAKVLDPDLFGVVSVLGSHGQHSSPPSMSTY